MASISHDRKTGLKTLQFISTDGKRRSIRLGTVPMKTANEVKIRVEQLLACLNNHTANDADLSRWLANIGDELHIRLAAVGLVTTRESLRIPTLREVGNAFVDSLPHVRDTTNALMRSTINRIAERLGAGTPINQITEQEAAGMVKAMKAEKAATATISKHVQICRRLFAFALRKKHITENPFAFIKGGTQVNRDRLQFVEAATVQVLLDSLVDPEWRLCIALARWGGLRVPSEIRDLKWGDIVWDRNRFVVSCVKTSGHEGKGTRIVPIFPEIKPYLEDLYERAEPGLYVFPKLRMFRGMPKLLVDRILAAGILPWIKPWQNLRSTRATELADLFPSHVAAAWLGHSVAVSDRHYRQVTDDHFEKAVLRAAKSGAVTLQNPVQSANVSECPDLTRLTQDLKECDVSQSKTDNVIYVQTSRLGVTGFEPVTSTV